MDELTKIKALLKNKPELLNELHTSEAPKKVSKTVNHGDTLAVAPSVPINISLKEAKRIVKASRAPRKPISDEQKKRMLENLAKGRETIKRKREALIGQQPSPQNVTLQIKPKQQKSIVAPKAVPQPTPQVDEEYEEWKSLKRKQAALEQMAAQKKKVARSGAFY